VKALLVALGFMTRLPLPAIAAEPRDYAAAIRWFPAAGLVIGAGVTAAAWFGAQRDPWLGALCGLVAWVALTGALHLDGLGDVADAVGAAHGDRRRVSAVLADPHIGSFGAVAIGLQLLAKLVLLKLALETPAWTALCLVPALARTGPMAWALTLAPLHEGMGALFRAGANWFVLTLWLAGLGFASMPALPIVAAALLAITAWRWWLKSRLGGISGDGHGAGIELVETACLLMLASWR
jgi:adenosylcobinamide-GDP ribazoletransferase